MPKENKKLKGVQKKIQHLTEVMTTKAHGKTSDDLKLLQQLQELYKQRNELQNVSDR
jgi:hypothetical protein